MPPGAPRTVSTDWVRAPTRHGRTVRTACRGVPQAAPKGLGYSSEARAFSYLLYLNEGWREEHGGCLRLFTGGGGAREGGQDLGHDAASFVDVQPRAGTLVLFRSDAIEHEVLDTFAPRLVLAGWWHSDSRGARLRRILRRVLILLGLR